MEKIKLSNTTYEITSINQKGCLLEIVFPKAIDITNEDLSSIEVLTSGGEKCTTLTGYTTIYKALDSENKVILSNDGSVYTEPEVQEPIDPVEPTQEELLKNAKTSKLLQVSNVCQNTIFEGTDITTSKGTQHFSLTLEDQTNIAYALNIIKTGATEFPYHADGKLCEMYSADDIILIANNLSKFKLYHTTYCNHLNIWINRCGDAEDVNTITYGVELPEDLQMNFVKIVGE